MLRVGILKFVNHRHREAGPDRGGKRFAIFTAQRRIEAAQHVVKPQLTPAAFLTRDGVANFRHGAGNHQIVER